jgi:NAD(P)-dependent dehydrogenase (short-subunit alcohol dehydrogenase family)/acyl carrier protein
LEVNGDDPGELKELFVDLLLKQKISCFAVMHLWNLDVAAQASWTPAQLERATELGCNSVLHVVQGLVQAGLRDVPRLWIVTRGAQAVQESEEHRAFVPQAASWGLSRAVMHEHPNLRCSLVDMAPTRETAQDAKQVARLVDEVCADGKENQLALRGDLTYTARLARCAPRIALPTNRRLELRPDGVYLLTGGLGGIGFKLAEWMHARGGRRFVLVDRQPASREAEQALATLRAGGATVRVVNVDISTAAGTSLVAAELDAMKAPLRGVVHAAGALDEDSVLKLSRQRLVGAMSAKLAGTMNILQLCDNRCPDFVVLMSSMFSFLGAPRQAALAAADAFQAAIAAHWRVGDRRVLSVHWSPWSGVGIASTLDPKAFQGIGVMTAEHALSALERLLRRSVPSAIAVMPFEARQWRQSYPKLADLPLLASLSEGRPRRQTANFGLRAKLDAMQPTERLQALRKHVQEQVGALLRPGEKNPSVDAEVPLDSFGLDSIKALDLRNRLERSLAVTLPVTLAWGGHPTIEHLVASVATSLGVKTGAADSEPPVMDAEDRDLIGVLGELQLIPE